MLMVIGPCSATRFVWRQYTPTGTCDVELSYQEYVRRLAA